MNKIIVEVSIGELFDKISILEIKKEKIKDPEKLKYTEWSKRWYRKRNNYFYENLHMIGSINFGALEQFSR